MTVRLLLRKLLLAGLIACTAAAWGAKSGKDPYIGYIYPAGGQQGTVFRINIQGQHLNGARGIYISGKGVHASVIRYERAGGLLNKLQQEELKRQLLEISNARTGGKAGKKKNSKAAGKQAGKSEDSTQIKRVTLPDLPELRNLDQMTPNQINHIREKFLNSAKKSKPPIAEGVTLEVTIDPNAEPGDRDLRLHTSAGLTNPRTFQIGQIKEVTEQDKDDVETGELQPINTPIVLNGEILPGEVDHYPLQLHKRQKLVVVVQARKLIPYLADAVPGWFQAVVSLRDSNGKELAFQDDCGNDPDPTLVFHVPNDGKYILDIRDALFRGREDFVYRVVVGDELSVKSLFPPGNQGGTVIDAVSTVQHQSLKTAREHFRFTGNPLNESESNNNEKLSTHVTLPNIISGRIAAPGDKDIYQFEGHAGQQIVTEIYARRMGSPIDSLLRLIDSSGCVVASNDDHDDKESGLLTHQADSYISTRLPATGRYFLQISDTQRHGGQEYSYYLRIGSPQPDFALFVTPSALNVTAGQGVAATIYAIRKDGWDGDIKVVLKDAPAGFVLCGGVIRKGRDNVRMTLTVPNKQLREPIVLKMEGSAQINGKTIIREVIPAEKMMQAFAYYHFVPSNQLIVMVLQGKIILPNLNMANNDIVKIPAGGAAHISFMINPPTPKNQIYLELNDPPAGLTIQDVKMTHNEITCVIKADDKHSGFADNLIIEMFVEIAKNQKNGPGKKQRVSLGVMPAIPFEIVPKGRLQK